MGNRDSYFTVNIPTEATGQMYKYFDGSSWYWNTASLDTWYLAGPGYGSYNEYVKFVADSSLDIANGHVKIGVSATVSSSDGNLPLRFKIVPSDHDLNTKVSNPDGTIASPPETLTARI